MRVDIQYNSGGLRETLSMPLHLQCSHLRTGLLPFQLMMQLVLLQAKFRKTFNPASIVTQSLFSPNVFSSCVNSSGT